MYKIYFDTYFDYINKQRAVLLTQGWENDICEWNGYLIS